MSELEIKCEVAPGADIEDCIREAKKLVKKTGMDVAFEHNGVFMHIHAKTKVKDALRYFGGFFKHD